MIQHRAYRLRIVNNRDFLTLTCQRSFTPTGPPPLPPPSPPSSLSGISPVMFDNFGGGASDESNATAPNTDVCQSGGADPGPESLSLQRDQPLIICVFVDYFPHPIPFPEEVIPMCRCCVGCVGAQHHPMKHLWKGGAPPGVLSIGSPAPHLEWIVAPCPRPPTGAKALRSAPPASQGRMPEGINPPPILFYFASRFSPLCERDSILPRLPTDLHRRGTLSPWRWRGLLPSMTRSVSVIKPDYPKPLPVAKGFTRGEVLPTAPLHPSALAPDGDRSPNPMTEGDVGSPGPRMGGGWPQTWGGFYKFLGSHRALVQFSAGAVVATCCAFLYQTDEGVHYTYTQRCDINLSLPVPKAIIHHGEKGHTQSGGGGDGCGLRSVFFSPQGTSGLSRRKKIYHI